MRIYFSNKTCYEKSLQKFGAEAGTFLWCGPIR